jgi:3-oxoacyl-ACP reductase-like protein
VGKPEVKRPHGRPRCRWEENTKEDLEKEGCGSITWIGLAQGRNTWRTVVNAVTNPLVP